MHILMLSLIAAHTYTGVGTQYTEKEHYGNALYCDRGDGLTYDRSTGPWVAFPKEAFESQDGEPPLVECGDWVTVHPVGWPEFSARVLDAGDLNSRTFRGGQPIVVDVPDYWATWTQPIPYVSVTNWSALERECRERGWCD